MFQKLFHHWQRRQRYRQEEAEAIHLLAKHLGCAERVLAPIIRRLACLERMPSHTVARLLADDSQASPHSCQQNRLMNQFYMLAERAGVNVQE